MGLTKTPTKHPEMRLTKGARKVLLALEQIKTLAAAQDIHSVMRSEDPEAPGLTTVYRALDLLVAEGLVQAVELGEGEKRFELIKPGEHHHHLICSHCRDSVHLDHCLVDDLDSTIKSKYGFEVNAHILEIFGTCKRCSDKKARK